MLSVDKKLDIESGVGPTNTNLRLTPDRCFLWADPGEPDVVVVVVVVVVVLFVMLLCFLHIQPLFLPTRISSLGKFLCESDPELHIFVRLQN